MTPPRRLAALCLPALLAFPATAAAEPFKDRVIKGGALARAAQVQGKTQKYPTADGLTIPVTLADTYTGDPRSRRRSRRSSARSPRARTGLAATCRRPLGRDRGGLRRRARRRHPRLLRRGRPDDDRARRPARGQHRAGQLRHRPRVRASHRRGTGRTRRWRRSTSGRSGGPPTSWCASRPSTATAPGDEGETACTTPARRGPRRTRSRLPRDGVALHAATEADRGIAARGGGRRHAAVGQARQHRLHGRPHAHLHAPDHARRRVHAADSQDPPGRTTTSSCAPAESSWRRRSGQDSRDRVHYPIACRDHRTETLKITVLERSGAGPYTLTAKYAG